MIITMIDKYKIIYGQEYNKILRVFESLSGYEIDLKLDSLKRLEVTYLDPFDINNEGIHFILPDLISDKHLFLIGRSGSGKTTYFLRAYWDCLKTIIDKKHLSGKKHEKWKKHETIAKKRIFPVFVNLFKYESISEIQEHYPNSISNVNIIRLTYSIVKQIKDTLNESIYETIILEKLKKSEKKINKKLEELIKNIKDGNEIVKEIFEKEKIEHKGKKGRALEVGAEILPGIIKPTVKISGGKDNYIDVKTKFVERTITNIHEIFKMLSEVLNKLEIDYCVLFIDQFSEINKTTQQFLMEKVFPFFIRDDVRTTSSIKYACKIAAYPSRIELGPFRLDREFRSTRWLDKNVFIKSISANKNFNQRIDLIQYHQIKFLKTLIEKRFLSEGISEKIEFDDLFVYNNKYNDILKLLLFLYFSTMNIPRYLGLILKLAFERSSVNKKGIDFDLVEEIVKNELYDSQRSILTQTIFNEWYERQWVIRVYQNILNRLFEIKYNQKEKKRFSAYFLMDKTKRPYLRILEDAFLIHHISEIGLREARKNKSTSSKLDFYMVNMKHVLENNYPTDIISLYRNNILNQSKFDFSDLIEPREEYLCPICGIIEEKDVTVRDGKSYCQNCLFDSRGNNLVEFYENVKLDDESEEKKSEYANSIKKEFDIEFKFQNFMKKLYGLGLITSENSLEIQVISILYKTLKPLTTKEISLKLAISIDPRTLAAVTRRILFGSKKVIKCVSSSPNKYQLNLNLFKNI